jgi:SAM-dependent methyltransferase
MDQTFTEALRSIELDLVLNFIPTDACILEVGAGAGWQAKMLAERGFKVEAIDIAESNYAALQVWPVHTYDGRNIPFPNESFDVVFTSSVLEHVLDLGNLFREFARVLKPQGIAIHVLPTPAWRLWTTITHYPSVIRSVLNIRNRDRHALGSVSTTRQSVFHLMKKALIPSRHGETGNTVTELFHFSRHRWEQLFVQLGWTLQTYQPCDIYYSGHSLVGNLIPIYTRQYLAHYLGSATAIYLLKKNRTL